MNASELLDALHRRSIAQQRLAQGNDGDDSRERAALRAAVYDDVIAMLAADPLDDASAALAAARATIERHEARAREHAEERAGLCTELARVTEERDAAECERDALYDTAREWVRAEDALTAAIVAADGRGADDAYAAAVTRRNAAHVALRAAMVMP